MEFQELNNDQRREAVNSQQRYAAYRDAKADLNSFRGSMIWSVSKSREYLVRSYYDKTGIRRQSSLGARAPETEHIKLEYDRGRREAEQRFKDISVVMARQAAVNRAVGLARVPLIGAKIIRALDNTGVLGSGIRVLGTNAIYAYEAAAGIRIDSGLTATEDIDLLLDSRRELNFFATEDLSERSLLRVLQKVDHSFQKSHQTFRAVNRDGYLVDLIKPMRAPPWTADRETIGNDPGDLTAAEIEGLAWHESGPAFEAFAIDDKGEPLRIVATDPRVWAAHKFWLSKRQDRDAIKRRRDEAQARAIAQLVTRYLPHLPYAAEQLMMLPKNVFDEAEPLFKHASTDA
jgi:hypothetical protein